MLQGKRLEFSGRFLAAYHNDASFYPEGSYTSYFIAKELSVTSRSKARTRPAQPIFRCDYHCKLDKSGEQWGRDGENKNIPGKTLEVKGIPAAFIKVSDVEAGIDPEPGYAHCGCRMDDLLFGRFLWKTLTVDSPETGIKEEGWEDFERLHPRLRRMMFKWWKESTGLSIHDIFLYDDRKVRPFPGANEDGHILFESSQYPHDLVKSKTLKTLNFWKEKYNAAFRTSESGNEHEKTVEGPAEIYGTDEEEFGE